MAAQPSAILSRRRRAVSRTPTPPPTSNHPQDGVYPEKVNAGRKGANDNMRRIGQNVNPANIKFSGQSPSDL